MIAPKTNATLSLTKTKRQTIPDLHNFKSTNLQQGTAGTKTRFGYRDDKWY